MVYLIKFDKLRLESGTTLGMMKRGATILFMIIQKQKQFKFRVGSGMTYPYKIVAGARGGIIGGVPYPSFAPLVRTSFTHKNRAREQ